MVPVGLCRKAWRKKHRRQLLKKGLLIPNANSVSEISNTHWINIDGREFLLHSSGDERFLMKSMDADEELMKLENKMWEKFYRTGLWRNLSQRINLVFRPTLETITGDFSAFGAFCSNEQVSSLNIIPNWKWFILR
ncbi:hypothetical protein L6452_34704 [Arctium lappa]|uniref:Uncharacterized protein n=1 Tax=Arctium lappa TaxID=4217 RepID=A0ACB8YIZ5_ARCLA|nr:hypothetical protein L6452_34704 [Arctium lappa]